jgi:hypothetical protein
MAITIAEKVLIVGGVLNLAYGTLLGYPITVIRAKGAPATPRYLMATHISTLLHAAVLLSLAGQPGCPRWAWAGTMQLPGCSSSPPR